MQLVQFSFLVVSIFAAGSICACAIYLRSLNQHLRLMRRRLPASKIVYPVHQILDRIADVNSFLMRDEENIEPIAQEVAVTPEYHAKLVALLAHAQALFLSYETTLDLHEKSEWVLVKSELQRFLTHELISNWWAENNAIFHLPFRKHLLEK